MYNNLSQNILWKRSDAENLIVNYQIRISENRRYDFWWDYVGEMKTTKKKISGKLTLQHHSTYEVEELVLYHPHISYQRRGMNDRFYDDDIWNHHCFLK